MMDKSNSQKEDNTSLAYELSYFTNAFPVKSEVTEQTLNAIKAVSVITVVIELFMSGSLLSSVQTYVARQNEMGKSTEVIVAGTFVWFVNCAAKVIAATHSHTYASKHTERTPENKGHMQKWQWTVTLLTTAISTAIYFFLSSHSQSHQELQGPFDVRVSDHVNTIQNSIIVQICLGISSHYLVSKLHGQEDELPKILDHKAASVKLD